MEPCQQREGAVSIQRQMQRHLLILSWFLAQKLESSAVRRELGDHVQLLSRLAPQTEESKFDRKDGAHVRQPLEHCSSPATQCNLQKLLRSPAPLLFPFKIQGQLIHLMPRCLWGDSGRKCNKHIHRIKQKPQNAIHQDTDLWGNQKLNSHYRTRYFTYPHSFKCHKITLPILHMKTLRLREIGKAARSHRARKCESWNLNSKAHAMSLRTQWEILSPSAQRACQACGNAAPVPG